MFPDKRAKMTETMLEMGDEEVEEVMKRLRSNIREEMGNDPEPVFDGMMEFLQERNRRGKDHQEEAEREAEKQCQSVRNGSRRK